MHTHTNIYSYIHILTYAYLYTLIHTYILMHTYMQISYILGVTHRSANLSERSFPLLISRIEARDLKNVEIIGIYENWFYFISVFYFVQILTSNVPIYFCFSYVVSSGKNDPFVTIKMDTFEYTTHHLEGAGSNVEWDFALHPITINASDALLK